MPFFEIKTDISFLERVEGMDPLARNRKETCGERFISQYKLWLCECNAGKAKVNERLARQILD